MTKYQKERHERKVKMIREIAKELRDFRNRDAAYAMKAGRRYARLFFK